MRDRHDFEQGLLAEPGQPCQCSMLRRLRSFERFGRAPERAFSISSGMMRRELLAQVQTAFDSLHPFGKHVDAHGVLGLHAGEFARDAAGPDVVDSLGLVVEIGVDCGRNLEDEIGRHVGDPDGRPCVRPLAQHSYRSTVISTKRGFRCCVSVTGPLRAAAMTSPTFLDRSAVVKAAMLEFLGSRPNLPPTRCVCARRRRHRQPRDKAAARLP